MKITDLIQLNEMPRLIGDVDFYFADPVKNHQKMVQLNKTAQFLFQHKKLKVFKSGAFIYARDDVNGLMPYVIQTEEKFISAIGETAIIQRKLWRSYNNLSVAGLPAKVFFEVLLKQFSVIATDYQQTEDGRRFWELRISEALDKGLHVYFLKATGPREMRKISPSDLEIDPNGEIWGYGEKYQAHWVLISDHELTPKDDVQTS